MTNETADKLVVNGVELTVGGIYLRDKNTGRVYQYEDLLSQMGHIERFEFTGQLPQRTISLQGETLSAQERAAELDRLASMPPDEAKAEQVRREAEAAEQARLAELAKTLQTKKLVMADAAGPSYESYKAKGWTDEQLVEAGHASYA